MNEEMKKMISENEVVVSEEFTPGIAKILELSTANIEQKTSQWLLEDPIDVNVHPKGEYGFFIFVDQDMKNVSQDLQIIMEYASKLECTWIVLDRDYPENHELPIYE